MRLYRLLSGSHPVLLLSWRLDRGADGACARVQSNIRAYKGPVVFSDPPLADHPGPLRNAAQVQGNIVIIRRGGVSFFDKAKRAANAGAAGILFVNNADDVFFAECEGIPCDIPSVTIPLGAYERLADLKMLDPISWFVCVDVPDPALVATCIADTLASGKKLRLHATVVSASGLRNADHDTHLDPFIEITCADQFRRTRTHRGGGSQPIWNQRLNFVLEEGVTHISLRCQDEESSAGADLVGSATVPLDDLFQIQLGTPYAAQVPITSAYGTTAGTVFLQMSLALAPSRCRSSARHAARGAIHVVAICGENLPPPPALGDKGNPFLKVQVGGISKRSPVHKGGHTKAVWNHSMRFLMPRARLGTAPLVRLNLQVWDERDDGEGRRVPLGCEGSIALPALQAKGDLWEGWVSMGGGARVKCKVVCVEAPPAMIASEKKKGAVVRNRGLLDADLALFYMMLFTFLVAVPPLRSVLLWHLLPAVLVSMSVGALLLLGGLVVKRRVFAPILIKSCLGALTDIGHYIEPVGLVKKTADARGGGGRPQFASDVTIENDVSIYQFYCFLFTTGKLTLRRLSIPQPTSREWQLGDDIFLQAECVQVHAAPSTLKTRTPLVHSVIVSGFELSIKVTEGMKSNVLALARSIHESSSCFFRYLLTFPAFPY